MTHLANQHLRVTITDNGSLLAVENHLAAEAYHLAADTFAVESDQGRFSNDTTRPSGITPTPDGLIFHFTFAQVTLDLIYHLDAANGFFRRHIKFTNQTPLRLYKVTLGDTVFAAPADEVIHYLTFWMAPTVEFIRYEQGGLFTGIENPFYQAELTAQGGGAQF